jgi:hypothetical protein
MPTTKEEMYSTLQILFAYYRYNREEFIEQEIIPLDIGKITYVELSDEELLRKAEDLLKAKQEERLMNAKAEVQKKIDEIAYKVRLAGVAMEKSKENYSAEYWKDYEEQIDNLLDKHKYLLLQYNMVFTGMADYYLEEELQTMDQKHQAIVAVLDEQLSTYQAELQAIEGYYAGLFEQEINVKFIELKDEQEKTKREVFKYNNAIDEKIQRYENSLKQANATLKLKVMSIRAEPVPKETLIEVGYYKKVMEVVSAYYNTLPAIDAYHDIIDEPSLAVYLEDYYQDMVYLYKIRAT